MGAKTQQVGGGGATPVANDWQAMLGQGLTTGVYGAGPGNMYGATSTNQAGAGQRAQQAMQGMNPVDAAKWMRSHPDTMALANGGTPQNIPGTTRPWGNGPSGGAGAGGMQMPQSPFGPGSSYQMQGGPQINQNMMPPTGGMGVGQVGQPPMQQTANGMQQQYAQGMPTGQGDSMPQQPGGLPGYINQQLAGNPLQANYFNPNNQQPGQYQAPNAMQFDFSAIQNPGASGLYGQAQNAMMGLGNQASQFAMQGGNDPYGGLTAPGGSAGQFSSQGLLGDRSNVTNAITQASNTQRADAVADARARFTANGGMAFGTPAAYAEALTNARMGEALNTSLANADLAYRGHDLGAYSAQENAILGHRNIDSYNYGNQLQALNSGRNFALNAMGQAGQNFQNVAGNEFAQQGMGFNYNQLGQQGLQNNQQMNLQSGLGFGQMGLDGFNANSNNWARQAGFDLNQRGMGSAQQQNLVNQLFGAYGQSTGLGTPQAQMIQVPTLGQNILDTAVGGVKMASGLGWQPFGAKSA